MTNETKQTAVEFLMEKLFDPSTMVEEQIQWFKEAKEMEKEQIKQSWVSAWQDSMINPKEYRFYEPDAEQYYDETYGGNKWTSRKSQQS